MSRYTGRIVTQRQIPLNTLKPTKNSRYLVLPSSIIENRNFFSEKFEDEIMESI